MTQRTIRSILIVFSLGLVSATTSFAQSSNSTEVISVPIGNSAHDSRQAAHLTGPSKGKLFVVTLDQPNRRQSCRIQSFTKNKLVCLAIFSVDSPSALGSNPCSLEYGYQTAEVAEAAM